MRPGQTAPECIDAEPHASGFVSRFNEAGADCPGMLWTTKESPAACKALQ